MYARVATFEWAGFDFEVQGRLMTQHVDLSGSMRFAYERCVGFYKDFHTHERLMFVFPRGASVMKVRTPDERHTYRVDRQTVLIVPAHKLHDDEGVSSIYDTFALYPSSDLLTQQLKRVELTALEAHNLQTRFSHVERSAWLDQLVQKYFFERVISKEKAPELGFYEQEIVRELFRLVVQNPLQDRLDPGFVGPITRLALEHIESNLFSSTDLSELAGVARCSVSTLVRHFRTDTGLAPQAYVVMRRLEEARILLLNTDVSVSEVAMLVGYQKLSAFSDAFKRRYGRSPRSLRQTIPSN